MYSYLFVFFNDTATTEIYTLSLHDALPILRVDHDPGGFHGGERRERMPEEVGVAGRVQQVYSGEFRLDRKSTRLNSSHANISYAVFCLKKKHLRDLIRTLLNS